MIEILIVDDERDVELLFNNKLKKEIKEGSIKLSYAYSAEEAIEYLSKVSPFDIIVVLSDINMPGMSGLELLKYSKKFHPALKVIMISAYDDDGNRAIASEYGADDFINKPVDFIKLREKLNVLIQNKHD